MKPTHRATDLRTTLLLVLFSCAAAIACSPAKEESGEGADRAPVAEEAASATSSGGRWLGEVRVGGSVDPAGAVPVESATDRFAPGESIYVSMAVADAPENAAVHTVFLDAAGEKIAEDEKKVPAEAQYLYFDAGDTVNWLPGEYTIEIAVDGEVRERQSITLAAGED